MAFSSQEKQRLMTKVCIMYYIDGMNQQEIADKLGVSRPQISRMITNARAEGIVDITIKDVFAEERVYEKWLSSTFDLHTAVVVDTPDEDVVSTPRIIARSACEILEAMLRNGDVVGVSAGKTVSQISKEFKSLPRKSVSFVSMVGGIGSRGTEWQANFNARNFANNCDTFCHQLNAPMLVASSQTYNSLINEPEISKVLSIAKNCDIAVTGIGQLSEKATIIKSGFLSNDDIQELKEKGSVASICCSFLDIQGKEVLFQSRNRMFGVNIEDLKKISRVIAVAWGLEKMEAIIAALRAKCIHTLITTYSTAKAIHEYLGNPPL